MALELIKTVAPCLTYEAYTPPPRGYLYHPELITPPRRYLETISRIKQFFYDPVCDVLVCFLWFDYAYWPGWRSKRIVWDAGTGALSQTYPPAAATLLFSHWTNHISFGGHNKFYATGHSFLTVKEVDWQTQSWLPWETYNWPGRNPPAFHQAIVNRQDKLIVGNALDRYFWVVNYGRQEVVGRIACNYGTHNAYMCWESEEHFWCVYQTGQLVKVNYQTRRHELLTAVAAPAADDLTYRCAFDPRRNCLVVLRHKQDAEDGACRLQLEWYRPVPRATLLTQPVPVTSLRTGERITFTAALLGDSGEGIAARQVTATLAAPASGTVLTPRANSGPGGVIEVGYLPPENDVVETLTLTCEAEEG